MISELRKNDAGGGPSFLYRLKSRKLNRYNSKDAR